VSAVTWSAVVAVVAGLLLAVAYLLTGLSPSGLWNIPAQTGAVLVAVGACCSGTLCLLYLWSGVVLHRRCIRDDRMFRTAVGGIVAGYSHGAATGDLSRRQLVDRLGVLTGRDQQPRGTGA
jgi:hypothetical protein